MPNISRNLLPCFAAALLSTVTPAGAIVDANSQSNTDAPADGAPWANVGNVNGATGIYLGAGWMMTASHVGPGDAILNGGTFRYDGSSLRLTNSDSSLADIVLFHLGSLPDLPRLTLATRTPNAGSQFDVIGYGHIAGSAQSSIATYLGFYWSANGIKSWGSNKVAAGGVSVINAGAGPISAFNSDFSAPGPTQTTDECQAAAGDSGGGLFTQSGSTWQLAGMVNAIGDQNNQPANTSVYGDHTYYADIATYASQINAVLSAAPPSLTISISGGNVLLGWPDTGVTFNLEAAPNLSNPVWVVISPTLTSANGQYSAQVPVSGNLRFFRLHKP